MAAALPGGGLRVLTGDGVDERGVRIVVGRGEVSISPVPTVAPRRVASAAQLTESPVTVGAAAFSICAAIGLVVSQLRHNPQQ